MKRKRLSSILVTVFTALLFSLLLTPIACNASTIWSDDCEDLDEWTITQGDFSCQNGFIECTAVEKGAEPDDDAWIQHESNVTTGTWSFDAYFSPDTGRYLSVMIISGDDTGRYWVESVAIMLSQYEIILWLNCDEKSSWDTPRNIKGTWTHIDVTVNADWLIDIFVNGSHRIHYNAVFAVTETSNNFLFWPWDVGHAIDNIVVNDTIDYGALPFPSTPITTTPTDTTETTPATTTTTTTPTDTTPATGIPPELLAVGIGVPVILVIVLVVWKVRK